MTNEERVKKLRQHQPYKDVYEAKGGKGYEKKYAERDVLLVWYCTSKDQDNPYRNIPPNQRKKEAMRDMKYSAAWELNQEVDDAIERLKTLNKTIEERMLDAAEQSMEAVIRYFNNASLDETRVDADGNRIPIVSITDLVKNLKEAGSLLKSIQSLKEQSAKGAENRRALGDASIGEFERI